MSAPRLALDPPPGPLTVIDNTLVDRAVQAARESPRQRIIAPFHKRDGELLHRMLNAVEPGSYVRPHRHLAPPKDEAWLLMRGSAAFFTFDEDGLVKDTIYLSVHDGALGIDLVPGVYHSFIALETGTVIYEVKTGPYSSTDDKAFAEFAPPEGSPEVPAYMQQLRAIFADRCGR